MGGHLGEKTMKEQTLFYRCHTDGTTGVFLNIGVDSGNRFQLEAFGGAMCHLTYLSASQIKDIANGMLKFVEGNAP
jgi:hypothetical protein